MLQYLLMMASYSLQSTVEPGSIKEITQLGLGYLVVFIILVPLVKWLMSFASEQSKSKDKNIQDLLDELKQHTKALNGLTVALSVETQECKLANARLVSTQEVLIASLSSIEKRLP